MKHIFTISLCFLALSLSAQETITYPYNPDGDADGAIASPDLLDILGVYGGEFSPSEIQIDGVGLLEVIQDLQNQLASIQPIDVNYFESTLEDVVSQLIEYQNAIEALQSFRCGDSVFHNGDWYATASIAGQCWFTENVRYLPEVSPGVEGSDSSPHGYVYYYQGNDVEEAKNALEYYQYGALYNFPAVEQWDLCPSGWHIPSDAEWSVMTGSIIGGSQNTASDTTFLVSSYAGAVMKKSFPNNQIDENEHLHDKFWLGTNSSGFSGLPGGWKNEYGYFFNKGLYAYWWTSSSQDSGAWYRILSYDDDTIIRDNNLSSLHAFSVRCIKD